VTPERADAYSAVAAAYVHIPFCSAVCPYCDFAVVAGRDDLVERYVKALLAEIELSGEWRALGAVYFGGGTPSHIDSNLLASVLNTIEDTHGLEPAAEVCLEANPEDFTTERAEQLVAAGFNRVSFGAQSFDDGVLVALGRRHVRDAITESVHNAVAAGFERISVDLIYGTPGESDRSWKETVSSALALGTGHISCYALTVERGTALGRAVDAGAPEPDPDIQADRYEAADRMIESAGLQRYEVSNWARDGEECRYNMVVWAQGEYEAYGNGAHGFRNGRRFRNHRRVDAYIERVEEGVMPRAGTDRVTGWESELDRVFVGLRRSVGVGTGDGTDALLASAEGKSLVDAGVIVSHGDRLVVTRPLLTDAVHRSVLALTGPIVRFDGDA
jgi:putative oxygen-independent coproporphyrinogen III oxidase